MTATTINPTGTLTPETVDKYIAEYQLRLEAAQAAQEKVDEFAVAIIGLVQQHGTRPETAAQSIRLQGVHNEATVTMGVTRSLHEPSIETLREYMKGQSLVYLFKRMFSESTKYTLVDGAGDVLNGIDIPKRTREKVLQFFGMCISMKSQKPKLTVKAIKPVAPKKPRGKVAA